MMTELLTTDLLTTSGGCHCGAVQFELQIEQSIHVQHCNCSICRMSGFVHLIVPASRFQLLNGSDAITEYQFNSKTARHFFCSKCGIKSFYVPRSNPQGYSINFRCIKVPPELTVIEEEFDGQNWEQNAGQLSHLA